MSKQQLKIIIMTIIISVHFLLIGTTYAYFQVRIVENKNEESINVTSKKLEVTYIDGDAHFSGSHDGYVFPGETFTKYFSVKNTGDDSATFNIILRDITNNFTRKQDWTYKLGVVIDTNLDGLINSSDYISFLTETPIQFPDTNELVTIYSSYIVEKQNTANFVLIVEYANSEDNQSIDMNQTLTATIDIAAEEITETD